jgi:hypothetical protein
MAIIKVIDGVFVGFYDRFQLAEDYPDVGFPLNFLMEENPEIVNYNAYPCRVLPAPVYDPRASAITLDSPTFQDGEWVQGWIVTPLPAELIPIRSIDKRRARLALLNVGVLADVKSAINAAGESAQIEWDSAEYLSEDSPLFQAIIQQLNWDKAMVDHLFEVAFSLI